MLVLGSVIYILYIYIHKQYTQFIQLCNFSEAICRYLQPDPHLTSPDVSADSVSLWSRYTRTEFKGGRMFFFWGVRRGVSLLAKNHQSFWGIFVSEDAIYYYQKNISKFKTIMTHCFCLIMLMMMVIEMIQFLWVIMVCNLSYFIVV